MMANLEIARMPLVPALDVLARLRTDQVVVTTMGGCREWPRLSNHPLDFNYIPATMGGAVSIGLGVALAQPDREVIVLGGDGSLLMNLGCLVTTVAAGAKNLTVIVLDNACYETIGGQRTAASAHSVDYAAMASAAGFITTAAFDALETWRAAAADLLQRPGPRFISLRVQRVDGDYVPHISAPLIDRIARFRRALATGKEES